MKISPKAKHRSGLRWDFIKFGKRIDYNYAGGVPGPECHDLLIP